MNRYGKRNLKARIWEKTEGKCARCGKVTQEARRTIDHYIPRSQRGSFDERNLIPLCKTCNKQKAYRFVDIFDYYRCLPKEYADQALEYEQEWRSLGESN